MLLILLEKFKKVVIKEVIKRSQVVKFVYTNIIDGGWELGVLTNQAKKKKEKKSLIAQNSGTPYIFAP